MIGTKREPKERKCVYRGRAVKHRESKTTVFSISRLGNGGKEVSPITLLMKRANFCNFGFLSFFSYYLFKCSFFTGNKQATCWCKYKSPTLFGNLVWSGAQNGWWCMGAVDIWHVEFYMRLKIKAFAHFNCKGILFTL